MTDPRNAKTLGEACANGDGTYNGLNLLSWLSEAINPGKGLSAEEVKKIFEQVKNEQRTRSGNRGTPRPA